MSAIDELLDPIRKVSLECLRIESLSMPRDSGGAVQLPRVLFNGPRGGGDAVRIGLFAGIHGDEPAGCQALIEFVRQLAAQPLVAEGYQLFFYPVCNPTGFVKGARLSDAGKDLNREFWRDTVEPEVLLLESEIRSHAFHGLISLHTDDTSSGIYGYVRGAVLTRALLEPALVAAEKIIPRNLSGAIDGFPAENGIISQCFEGILASPPELEAAPFEIILETPHSFSREKQVQALTAAARAVLMEYREFLAFAANL